MSELLFLLLITLITTTSVLIAFKTPSNAVRYFKTGEGKRVLTGIVIVISVALLIVGVRKALADEIRYFNHASVYVGIDYTKKLSPMCDPGGHDERATSNVGFRLNVLESDRTVLNAKYTHHSCAFNQDNRSYDAFGLELSYKFWTR